MRPNSIACKTRGFTLVELLVVIAIIAMLMTALLPAIQAVRGHSRRAQCKNNMLQLIMAIQNYELAHEHYPAGVMDDVPGPIRSEPNGHHHGWLIALLPYLDEASLHRNIDQKLSVYDQQHQRVRTMQVPVLTCPSQFSSTKNGFSSYAACHHDVEAPIDADNHGVFFLNSQIMPDDVRDGLTHTIFLGEKPVDDDDLGWMSGTRASLRNTGSRINASRWKRPFVAPAAQAEPKDDEDEGYFPGEEAYLDYDADALEDLYDAALRDAEGTDEEPEVEAAAEAEAEAEAETQTVAPRAAMNPPQATPLSVGGFGSRHPEGAHMAFGDGRIQLMYPGISARVFQQLGHRDDGQLLDADDYR